MSSLDNDLSHIQAVEKFVLYAARATIHLE
jgi:hypothetical protein